MRKFKNNKYFNNNLGITLISLVITIIVLLILAGVSIAMLTGENGILTQAQRAKNETENATRKEEEDLAKLEAMVNGEDIVITPVDDENPGQLEQEDETTFVINSIEDLVVFSHNVRNGNKYEGQTVKLGVNLDFKSDKSYVDPDRTDYGIYGYDGNLKQLLTTGEGFIPIGDQEGTNSFYGTFDGDNNAICSLYINIESDEDVNAGFFSTTYGEIRNLGLLNTDIKVKGKFPTVGGATGVGYNNIYNSYTTGNINVIGNSWMITGGICGVMKEEGNVENCYNLSNINIINIKEETGGADISCGGIIGQTSFNIDKCYNKGNISGNGGVNSLYVGGICGSSKGGTIKNCYNNAKLEGKNGLLKGDNYSDVGGIIGYSKTNNIENCYNSGEIIANSDANSITGGIIAHQLSTCEIMNIFNSGNIKIENDNIHSAGGILGFRGGHYNMDISDAYNIGKINIEEINTIYIGAITGTSDISKVTFNDCYYLINTYSSGVGESGFPSGVTEWDSTEKFPSVLEVVNAENAFMEDINNINGGYPILKMEN